jgi:DNA gyrase/topoisomerase IV subunit B
MPHAIETKKEYQYLGPYLGLRTRMEMYFGSRDPHTQAVVDYQNGIIIREMTWTPAAFTAIREIIDNAIDELIAHGHGDRIDITYDPASMVFSVADNGRGIPIEWDAEHNDYAAAILLSNMHSGRNFDDDARGETRGMNGVGAKGVNFSSEWFDIEINRDNKRAEFRFRESEGREIIKDEPLFYPTNTKETGTKIRFKLSEKVYKAGILLPEEFIAARVYEIALCYPQIKVFYNDKKIQVKNIEQALFTDRKPIRFTINAENFNSRFWLIPEFMEDGTEFTHTLVNLIPAFNGGTHIEAFRRGFYSGVLSALARESKKRKLEPNKSDVSDGMFIYNITQMSAPNFDSQAKTRMINESVSQIVRKQMDDPEFFKKVVRENPDWIESIYDRCRIRTQKSDEGDLNRLAKKGKKQKITDLDDAVGADRSKCILFLAEGKSAISGIVQDRNAEIHGGLPLRGKPMNVREKTLRQVMLNDTLKNIMNSIGLVPGQRVNRHLLRYGKIYITTDADEDGKNIAALLVNFFYFYWPELFDPTKAPYIFLFDTPLIIAVKGKIRKYWYNENYDNFDNEKHKGWDITRAKGLAALKRLDWKYVLENPKLLPFLDDGNLEETLKKLFTASRADDRKDMMGIGSEDDEEEGGDE